MEATELGRAAGAEVIALANSAASGSAKEGAAPAREAGKLKLLGTLIIMSVPQGDYSREDLIAAMGDAGLDEAFAPREPSERDAFRRATSSLAVNRIPVDAPSPSRLFGNERRYANVLIRDARTSGSSIVRLAVREVVDAAGTVLDYMNAAHHEGDGSGRLGVEESSFALCILCLRSGYDLRIQRVASILACLQVDVTSANQSRPSSRPQTCIMRDRSCSLKPAVGVGDFVVHARACHGAVGLRCVVRLPLAPEQLSLLLRPRPVADLWHVLQVLPGVGRGQGDKRFAPGDQGRGAVLPLARGAPQGLRG